MTKPKFSWGVGITIVYTTFALATLSFVAYAFSQKVELVADNYYKQEMQYQQRINESSAALALDTPVRWNLSDDRENIILTFPAAATATVILYRPSNSALDKTFTLSAGSDGTARIPIKAIASGFWRMKIQWNIGDKKMYNEFSLTL